MFRFLGILLFVSFISFAAPVGIGFLVEFEGDIKIYRDLGIDTQKKERIKNVKLEGKTMQCFTALKYEKLYPNDIITAGKSSKAKIILKNKNMIFLDEYGKIILPDEKTGKDNSIFDVVYGKVRGIVVKGKAEETGVKSPEAVMAVRGTDFMFAYSPYKGKTEVSVLRGEVELKKKEDVQKTETNKNEVKSEPVVIKSGFMASVEANKEAASPTKKEEKTPEPVKIPLEKLDEAKVVALIDPKKQTNVPAMEESKKEALESETIVKKEIVVDIVKEERGEKKEKEKKIDLNNISLDASVDKLLDKSLEEKGIDKEAYKKVPPQIRVKAREIGMKDAELTPRHIREKSKSDPETKSLFDSMVDMF